jgi:hypothetical protein
MDERLFHISEQPDIKIFEPRPSPSAFEQITGNVVFAVSDQLLHNYLLPRDCPRVTYYANNTTTKADKDVFFNNTLARFVVVIEAGWYQKITDTSLYRYEFLPAPFVLLDECAGYYISYSPVKPVAIKCIPNIITELLARNVELRFTPSLIQLADAVKKSSLSFSLIRMRNAKS